MAEIDRLEIDYAPGYRSTAGLLVGWLSAQMGWLLGDGGDDHRLNVTDPSGRPMVIALQEKAGDPVGRCSLFCGTSEFRVVNPPDADLLEISHHLEGKERMRKLMPASGLDPVALVREELMRGGTHRVYLRAVEAVREWL